jgi:hypothetical protein
MKRVIKRLSEDWRDESREITSISASHNTSLHNDIQRGIARPRGDAETLIVIIIVIISPMDDEDFIEIALFGRLGRSIADSCEAIAPNRLGGFHAESRRNNNNRNVPSSLSDLTLGVSESAHAPRECGLHFINQLGADEEEQQRDSRNSRITIRRLRRDASSLVRGKSGQDAVQRE